MAHDYDQRGNVTVCVLTSLISELKKDERYSPMHLYKFKLAKILLIGIVL